jgi:hypothetical protein
MAIDAVDYWRRHKLKDTLAHLHEILPLTNQYLVTKIEGRGTEFHDDDADEVHNKVNLWVVTSFTILLG